MKIRQGFVSNSSSSSFVLNKHYLSPHQIDQIKNHMQVAKELPEGHELLEYTDDSDAWAIYEKETTLEVSTIQDNFDMLDFLHAIGIPEKAFLKRWYS